jgi:hypothetical protein
VIIDPYADETDGTSETDGGTSYAPYTPIYAGTSISVCDGKSSDGLIGNLSSYVCEIVNAVGDLWKRSTVESTTESNLSTATRNAVTNQGSTTSYKDWTALESLKNTNNPDSGILYFKGSADSIVGKEITLGKIEVPCGGWTLIVENANLVLSGNITYASACPMNETPSIGFVVTGGNIHVKASAENLVGVYYTDGKFTGDDRSAVDQQLEIDGSLYGNIQELMDSANYVGSPSLDGGGLVIRYDSRIMLNTPPGLSEYVDVATEQAVN